MTKKGIGLIIKFDENDSDFEMQKFEVKKIFRFFLEHAKEDFLKNLEYKNYQEREIINLQISHFQNSVIEGLME